MKEQLELQHLAPYLPFKLKGLFKDEDDNSITYISVLETDNLEYFLDEAIIILRPLYDLQKDEFFDLYLDLCEELEVTQCKNMLTALENGQYYVMDIQKYKIMETFLSKHHFDWKYGLIEKCLAVDINTLNK